MRMLWSAILLAPFAAAATIGQIDTFQDGTTAGWQINLLGAGSPPPVALPTNIATGGPAGAGDRYLMLTAVGGSGGGSKLTVLNGSQWAGDYLAAGIGALTADVNNFGSTDLSLRLLFEDPAGGPPANVAFSSIPVVVPAGSGWMSVAFPILPADLTAAAGNVSAALSGATVIRLFHGPLANFPGPPVVASLGVDNIAAAAAAPVPEPSTSLLLGAGMLLIWSLSQARRRSRRAPPSSPPAYRE